MSPVVAVFGSSGTAPGTPEWLAAERCGRLLAGAGFTTATGGYGGVMEAVSKGAAEAGGFVIGVTAPAVFPGRSGANPHVHDERPAASLTERIDEMVRLADAAIALPGSIGTLTELLVVWNVAFVCRFNGATPQPIVAVGEPWRTLVETIASGLATDAALVTCVSSVDEAVEEVSARLR